MDDNWKLPWMVKTQESDIVALQALQMKIGKSAFLLNLVLGCMLIIANKKWWQY